MGRPLLRRDGFGIHGGCRSSPAWSLWSSNPAENTIIYFCGKFETTPTRSAKPMYLYLLEREQANYTPRHCFPFSAPLTKQRAAVEVLEPSCRWSLLSSTLYLFYNYKVPVILGTYCTQIANVHICITQRAVTWQQCSYLLIRSLVSAWRGNVLDLKSFNSGVLLPLPT
jgi:hypothetical protein